MRLALAAALLAAMTTEAAACHRFSVWRYPWPQRCFAARQVAWPILAHPGPSWPEPKRASRPAMPLPGLVWTDCVGGEADEPTRAHVLLRAALEAANGH